jgi:ubiquinone/menaquinone biosynthesis C-methylase UbiE
LIGKTATVSLVSRVGIDYDTTHSLDQAAMPTSLLRGTLALALTFGSGASSLYADDKSATLSRYETRANHDPDGIGKFYMGREIARVMGHQAADWLERPEREQEEQPVKLIETLKLKPRDVVADIGAGSGYYTFRLADRVGAKGKVYAVDIQPEMLTLIRERMKTRKLSNVEPILGTVTDPKLPPNSTDLILLVDVYHEFDHPFEMTQAMIRALRPGGRLVFVEFRLEDPKVPIKLVHKMSEKQVRKEMEPHPLRWIETIGSLPWQHVIVFKKSDPSPEPGERGRNQSKRSQRWPNRVSVPTICWATRSTTSS